MFTYLKNRLGIGHTAELISKHMTTISKIINAPTSQEIEEKLSSAGISYRKTQSFPRPEYYWEFPDLPDFSCHLGEHEFMFIGGGPYHGLMIVKGTNNDEESPFIVSAGKGRSMRGDKYKALARNLANKLSANHGLFFFNSM